MKIKTYHSESVPKALEKIRRDLGPNAVILETKRTKKRSFLGLVPKLTYEITAASEPPPPEKLTAERKGLETYEVAPMGAPRNGNGNGNGNGTANGKAADLQERLRPRNGASRDGGVERLAPEVRRISAEIGELKRLIGYRNPLASPALLFFRNDLLYEHFQHLVAQGIDENLAFSLIRLAARRLPPGENSREQFRKRLNQALGRIIRTEPIPGPSPTRAVVFLGPTGVGKTTTIAKLAAMFALGEQKKVQLVTLDTYRIGAAEQLKTYGEIIGVPVHVASSVSELREIIRRSADADYLLIDTVGHSHKRVRDFEELASFLRQSPGCEKHLVLSMATKPEDLREIIRGFDAFSIDKLLFTKLDESTSFGGIVNEQMRTGRPISYLTDGQNVPDDLIVPSAKSVADLLISTN
jgi:flagellar biosynthesis protein FlhF